MRNINCKGHRGRPLTNHTEALVICECHPHVTRIWAQVIENKTIDVMLH